MIIEFTREGKRIPLTGSESRTVVLLFVLSLILAWYAGGLIGACWCRAVGQIISRAEKRNECAECVEKYSLNSDHRVAHKHVPIEIPETEEA